MHRLNVTWQNQAHMSAISLPGKTPVGIEAAFSVKLALLLKRYPTLETVTSDVLLQMTLSEDISNVASRYICYCIDHTTEEFILEAYGNGLGIVVFHQDNYITSLLTESWACFAERLELGALELQDGTMAECADCTMPREQFVSCSVCLRETCFSCRALPERGDTCHCGSPFVVNMVVTL
jgi:hypothetical protein